MGRKILVVAAHPDDEVLGCGGAIALHGLAGDEVHILLAAEGLTSRADKRRVSGMRRQLGVLESSARRAAKALGAASVEMLGFPDNRMDSLDLLDIVKPVERAIAQHEPEIVYTHHAGDLNVDHRLTHEAVITAVRPMPGQTVKTLLFFEVCSSTEWRPASGGLPFQPNWFVDIERTLGRKLDALASYRSEIRPWPHSRSLRAVEHLARWRGAAVGVEAAEAFMLGRRLLKGGFGG